MTITTRTTLKLTLGLIIGLLLGCIVTHAQNAPLPPLVDRQVGSVFIAWDGSVEPDVSAYILHWGTNSSIVEMEFALEDGTTVTNTINTGANYTSKLNTGTNTSAKIVGLDVGVEYFFSVKAVRADGVESDFDIEISKIITVLPAPPVNPRIVKMPVYIIDVFFSDVPGEWTTNKSIKLIVDADKPYQFFTVKNRVETTDAILID
jgi:hypothetical protein